MNKRWSDQAWNTVLYHYNKITELKFIEELMDGTLASEKFSFYIHQDSIYLGEYGRVLAGIGARMSNAKQRSLFLKFASDTVFVEQELHRGYQETLKAYKTSEASPACLLYTSFLHKQLAMEPIEVAVAAILPCFVIYGKIGNYIKENQCNVNNPYQQWINTYGGEEFTLAVKQAEQISNDLAQNTTDVIRQQMTEAYVMASRMEYMFWDSAYKLEKWPLNER
ncbi:thiaminase II [Saccharicrinis fermentans]|uniref:Aminopyrimidine aminohydrolase n=1 Tax=Saccharicrinis fermentans DSM 9555 = JCM 21142 TaxID=869213 RepID=W7YE32_9BACT|nr:thiaminase II [Saccharicrinis fermentans]GAF02726.1 thiaminase-2 [Saccharicrinis fermentans DSM 9555 = JCM 21142]